MSVNGIDRIAERILADARTEAEGILSIARENSAQIEAGYQKQAEAKTSAVLAAAEKDCEALIERMKSEAQMQARSAQLSAKQEVVAKAFDLAQEKLLSMPKEDYSAFLVRLAAGAAVSGTEELLLNEKDKAALGQGTVKAANEALKAAGKRGELALAQDAADIKGGLKLRSESYEINCSLESLMSQAKEELSPKAASMLFA